MDKFTATLYTALIIICLPYVVSSSREIETKVIVDVLQSFNKPSHVIASLCWETTTKNQLTKSLAASDNPRSIKFVNNIHEKDLARAEQVLFLVDVSCEEAAQFLNKAASKKYFGRPYRWLIINEPNSEAYIPPEIEEKDMLPDSEVYVSNCGNYNCSIDLVYKIKPNRDWIIENHSTWSADSGLVVSQSATEQAIAMRRKNLDQESIATSTIIMDNGTLADLQHLRYKEIDSVTKAGYHCLTPLYDFLNASRELILTSAWGYHVNGTWTHMLGDLYEEKAELGGSIIYITEERMKVAEYLSRPTPIFARFIFREPPLSYQNNLYLLPFKVSVWCCIGLFVVVLIAAIYISAYWEARKANEEDAEDTSVLVPKVSDVAVFVMSAISQQGSNVELKGMLGRFVIFIVFLVFVFLYTAYSASIVVLLQSSSNQIRTLTDLLNSKLELGVEDTSYNRYWFMNEKEPIRKAIYEKKVAPSGSKPKFFEMADGIKQLQKKPFAFNCNLGTAYKLIERHFYEHEKCGLQEISYIRHSHAWQACRKGSPYREIFKIGLLRNGEHGLNDRTNRIMFSKKPECLVRGGSFVSVSIVDCYPILLLLLYGMILGVVLLLSEILHHRKTSG